MIHKRLIKVFFIVFSVNLFFISSSFAGYNNLDKFLSSTEANTCKQSSDGCNTFVMQNGEIIWSSNLTCKNYIESWTCITKLDSSIDFLDLEEINDKKKKQSDNFDRLDNKINLDYNYLLKDIIFQEGVDNSNYNTNNNTSTNNNSNTNKNQNNFGGGNTVSNSNLSNFYLDKLGESMYTRANDVLKRYFAYIDNLNKNKRKKINDKVYSYLIKYSKKLKSKDSSFYYVEYISSRIKNAY